MKKGLYLLSMLMILVGFTYAQVATFNYTGSVQTYTVPVGVTSVTIEAIGAKGGGTNGGLGGKAVATISVTPGEILEVYVGGAGILSNVITPIGGFNGGGGIFPSMDGFWTSATGGGASDVRQGGSGLANRVIVGGGGGGAGYSDSGPAGAGGLSGIDGDPTFGGCNMTSSGLGATQIAGGAGGFCNAGCIGIDGTFGIGGNGTGCAASGGGGGGGWYGGGGGAHASAGGGSNYAIPSATSVTHTTGFGNGDGLVIITPLVDPCSPDVTAPVISACPSNISVSVDPVVCGAVVNYSAPTATDNCSSLTTLNFNYTGSMQTFTVPAGVTSLVIQAKGGQGGNNGGLGADITGTVSVTPGEVLNILVGGQGETGTASSNIGGGGGGGTFVVRTGNIPLVIAGGGGGFSTAFYTSGLYDPAISNGQSGNNGASVQAGGGGTGGNGGSQGTLDCCASGSIGASGGSGFYTNGGLGAAGTSGLAYINGGAGGVAGQFNGYTFTGGNGGYGGGAGISTDNAMRCGGGGGYSGGQGGSFVGSGFEYAHGGGGGSYNIGTSQTNLAGMNIGNGSVIISYGSGAPTAVLSSGLPSGSVFPIGTTTNTFLATDGAGNTATCSFTVTVVDDEAPVLSACPSDVSMNADAGSCDAIITFTAPTATDNCGVASATDVYYIRSSAAGGEPWGQTLNMDAMDAVYGAGNWNSEYFETAAVGTVFSASTKFVFLEGSDAHADELNVFLATNLPALEAWVNNGGVLFINSAPNEGGNIDFGFSGTLLNYDGGTACGGPVDAVNVGDPIFLGPFTPVATSYTGTSFSHSHITGAGLTNVLQGCSFIQLAYKAWGTGNVAFGGMTTPNFHSPNPEAQNLRQNIIDWLDGLAPVGGGGSVTQTSGLPSGSAFPVGTTTNTFETVDAAGNSSVCSFTVIITDPEAPVADNANIDVNDDCNITLSAPSATDNCAGTVTGTTTDPLTYSAQGTYTVTWTYDDGNGNTSTQTQLVTIADGSAPLADVATLPALSGCNVTVSVTPTATDACEGAISGTTTDALTYSTPGNYTVTWSYDDGNGNTSTQTQSVTVVDCSGIEDQNVITLSMFPNPTNGIFTLSLISLPEGGAEIRILDELGQVVYTNQIQNLTQQYDFSYLSAATYYVQILSNDLNVTKALIITNKQ